MPKARNPRSGCEQDWIFLTSICLYFPLLSHGLPSVNVSFSPLKKFKFIFVWEVELVHVCHGVHVEVGGHHENTNSLFPPCGLQGWYLGYSLAANAFCYEPSSWRLRPSSCKAIHYTMLEPTQTTHFVYSHFC